MKNAIYKKHFYGRFGENLPAIDTLLWINILLKWEENEKLLTR